MGRVTWKNDNSKAGQEVLRGYLGDIPAFTIRPRTDEKFALTDRLQMEMCVHETEAGAQKDAEHRVEQFLERIGATVYHQGGLIQRPRVSDPGNKVLADTYRQMLQNVADGKNILDGFEDSALGGATRALRFWRNGWRFIQPKGDDKLELTDAGRKALETGEY